MLKTAVCYFAILSLWAEFEKSYVFGIQTIILKSFVYGKVLDTVIIQGVQ